MDQAASKSRTTWNPDKFRLRRLVERLVEMDEVEIHDEAVALSELSPIIENTKKGVLFKKAGPEEHEVVGAVSASRRRLAAAFGVPEEKMREEFLRRQANPQKTFVVPTSAAPVQEIVLTGEQIDLYKLPFHVQHEYDGGPYITSGNDFTIDPATKLKWTFNIGASGNSFTDIQATSTEEMAGGAGKIVRFDVANGKFHGYGIDE